MIDDVTAFAIVKVKTVSTMTVLNVSAKKLVACDKLSNVHLMVLYDWTQASTTFQPKTNCGQGTTSYSVHSCL